MTLILLFIQYSFNAQHVSAVNTTIFRSQRLTGCYFMGGIWFGVCWRSVSVWLWWCGVFMQSEALLFRLHKDNRSVCSILMWGFHSLTVLPTFSLFFNSTFPFLFATFRTTTQGIVTGVTPKNYTSLFENNTGLT